MTMNSASSASKSISGSTMPSDLHTLSDRELMLLLNRDVSDLRDTVHEALEQLKRGNERFQSIALRDQEIGAAIADLRQNYSRAMLGNDEARKESAAARAEIAALKGQFETYKAQVKAVAWVLAPVVGIAFALLTDVAKRWIGP